jgi:hypothetical protein
MRTPQHSPLRNNAVFTGRPRPFVTAILAACALLAGTAQAQTWEYKAYKKQGMGGQTDKDSFTTGTISIEEKDGQASFRMAAGSSGVCYRGSLPATVTKTDTTTVIEVTKPVSGCEEFRYVIQNDGSGGVKEYRRSGDEWVKSKFDHGLTPKK